MMILPTPLITSTRFLLPKIKKKILASLLDHSMVMVTKIDETASILHRWPSEKAAKCSDSRVVQQFSTQLQLSSCSLPSAAKARTKGARIRQNILRLRYQ